MFTQGCFAGKPPAQVCFPFFVVNPLQLCAMEPCFLSYHKRLTILLWWMLAMTGFPWPNFTSSQHAFARIDFTASLLLCMRSHLTCGSRLHGCNLWGGRAVHTSGPEVGSAAPPGLMLSTSCARARRSPPLQSDWRSPPLHDARGCKITSLPKIASQHPGAHVSLRRTLQSLIWWHKSSMLNTTRGHGMWPVSDPASATRSEQSRLSSRVRS